MSAPSGLRMSSVTDFLLRHSDNHGSVSPQGWGEPNLRSGSPTPGSSHLITSAPNSASWVVQNGPAMKLEISMMRMPSSGRGGLFDMVLASSALAGTIARIAAVGGRNSADSAGGARGRQSEAPAWCIVRARMATAARACSEFRRRFVGLAGLERGAGARERRQIAVGAGGVEYGAAELAAEHH